MALQEDDGPAKKKPKKAKPMEAQAVIAKHAASVQPHAPTFRQIAKELARRVEELVVQGATPGQIERILTEPDPKTGRPEFAVTPGAIRKTHAAVVGEMARIGRERMTPNGLEALRQAALRRLHDLRGRALFGERDENGPKDKDGRPTAWLIRPNLLIAHLVEKQIARIEGTEAPRKLDVVVDLQGQAVAEIMVGMDADHRRELEEEAAAEAELVSKARKMLPVKVIESVAESPGE